MSKNDKLGDLEGVHSSGQSGGITAGKIEAQYVAGGDIHITENASAKELLQLLEAMKGEIDQLDVPDKEKSKAKRRIEDAVDEAKSEEPDKGSISDSLEEAGTILEKVSRTALKATAFGKLLSQGLIWAGRAAGWL